MLFCRVAAAPYPAHRCVIRRPGKRSATRQLNPVRANMIRVENVHKTFVLHQQHGVRLPVLADASLTVNAGECVVLHGHSGSGKSTLLRSLYANYLPDSGHIHIRHGDEWVDLVTATPRKVLEVRKTTIGWVSQFLRVIPRISALEVVMQPLLDLGTPREASAAKAAQPADAVLVHGAGHILLHEFDRTVACGDVHTCGCIAFRIALFHCYSPNFFSSLGRSFRWRS